MDADDPIPGSTAAAPVAVDPPWRPQLPATAEPRAAPGRSTEPGEGAEEAPAPRPSATSWRPSLSFARSPAPAKAAPAAPAAAPASAANTTAEADEASQAAEWQPSLRRKKKGATDHLGAGMNRCLELELAGSASTWVFSIVNNGFLLIYMCEIFLRFMGRGLSAIRDALTCLDIALVLLTFVERMAAGASMARSLPSIRLLRLLRLIRAFKRMHKSKEPLRHERERSYSVKPVLRLLCQCLRVRLPGVTFAQPTSEPCGLGVAER
eukprot:g32628.t1